MLVYVALQVPLAYLAEFSVGVRDPMFGDKADKLVHRIDERTIGDERPVTVVMLGSSRTGYGFHGLHAEAVLEQELGRPAVAYNFGVPASGPITELIYLLRLVEMGVEPDLLIVEVLPSMLASDVRGPPSGPTNATKQLAPLEQLWFFPDRLRHRELAIVERCGFDSEKVRTTWRDTILHPWHSLRFQLLSRATPGWVTWSHRYDWGRACDGCGWISPLNESVTPEEYQIGVRRAHGEYAAVLSNLKPGGGAADALRESLALVREHDIPTVLILMPEGTDFQSWYSPAVREQLDTFMRELESEYGIRTIDARNWLRDSAFNDSHHMLKSGAIEFSDRLTREEILPRLRAQGMESHP